GFTPTRRLRLKRSSIGPRPRAHAVPGPSLAAELIESIKPNELGWFFPSAKDPSQPVRHGTLYSFVWRQRARGVIPYATGRDLRRTFKTLAGKAGKDIVSRTWRKVKGDWDAWNARSLADEPIVRLILDGTVVHVRLDRKATAISLLVVIVVRA